MKTQIPSVILALLMGILLPITAMAQPSNDDCSGATSLTVNTSCSPTNGTTVNATQSMPAINCNGWTGYADDDVWYSFVANNSNQTIQVSGNGSFDAVVELFSGSCGSLTSLACADNTTGGGTETISATGLTVGNTYYIRVYDWYFGNNGTFTICVYGTPAGNPGDDCANAISIACGDTLTNQTTYGNGNTSSSWSCHVDKNNFLISTPGEDRFYAVNVTDVSTTTVRVYLLNVVDTNAYIEVIFYTGTCTPGTCNQSGQYVVASHQFQGGLPYHDFSVPGAGTYYLIIDSQGAGVQSYDIAIECVASGIQFDDSGCGDDIDSNGYTVKWNGGTSTTLYPGDTGTLCYTVYVKNPTGWEWLKYVDLTLGNCWINISNITPDSPPGNNGFYDTNGDWAGSYNAANRQVNWHFTNSVNAAWGDDNTNNYTCHSYIFCFHAEVSSTCVDSANLSILLKITDDGIGGSGQTLPSNYSIMTGFMLPVEMLYFTGEVRQEGNYLAWATASESGSDYFLVERSADGQHFVPLGSVAATGNSASQKEYSFMDDHPLGRDNYYRLKIVDQNGQFKYSGIVFLRREAGTTFQVVRFGPNPVQETGNLQIYSADQDEISLQLMDMTGRVLIRRIEKVHSGDNTIPVSFSGVPNGVYHLMITNGYDSGVIKVVK